MASVLPPDPNEQAWNSPVLPPEDSDFAHSSDLAFGKLKVKRNRLVLSCQPCHKRKQQCDRGHPCQRCVKRGTTSTCVYDQPKEPKKSK
ncbi:hypothetical protein OF83DRAFT_528021 [Amylostereum chailletii]|nr:hypothetical protein OF83DRAFT_528021 [Amylostereum chailletii]